MYIYSPHLGLPTKGAMAVKHQKQSEQAALRTSRRRFNSIRRIPWIRSMLTEYKGSVLIRCRKDYKYFVVQSRHVDGCLFIFWRADGNLFEEYVKRFTRITHMHAPCACAMPRPGKRESAVLTQLDPSPACVLIEVTTRAGIVLALWYFRGSELTACVG